MSLIDVRKVVVPIDFSHESLAAVNHALDIVDGKAERVHLIHVLADMSPADPGVIWGEISDENRARHVKEAMVERVPCAQVAAMKLEVAFGDAGFRIADFAKRIQADLIVIPSHGRTGIKHLLIGSVVERVIQQAHCPVLVLRDGRRSE